jgi:hypothetical protein
VEIDTDAVTVTSTAQAIETGIADPVRLFLFNNSATTAYLGAAAVTSSTGLPLKAGAGYEFPVRVGDGDLYVVCASGTVDLRWMAVL